MNPKSNESKNHTTTDTVMVICFLGTLGIIGEIGMMILIHSKADGPSIALVGQLAGIAVGALSSILSSTKGAQQPQTAQLQPVVNTTVTAPSDQAVTTTVMPAAPEGAGQ